jgi:hypothetical protein
VEANHRGRDPDWAWAGDQCKCDACQCFGLRRCCACRDATSRRDGPGPAHGWRTWTCAWHNFQAPLPAPHAPKRDDADVYTGPEMRVGCSATPHRVFTVITSLISIPPSLSLSPSSTFADDAHYIAINAIAGLASSPTTPSRTGWEW